MSSVSFCVEKKSAFKCYIVYDSNYVTFCKRQNYKEQKWISGCPGVVWGRAGYIGP